MTSNDFTRPLKPLAYMASDILYKVLDTLISFFGLRVTRLSTHYCTELRRFRHHYRTGHNRAFTFKHFSTLDSSSCSDMPTQTVSKTPQNCPLHRDTPSSLLTRSDCVRSGNFGSCWTSSPSVTSPCVRNSFSD